MSDPVLAGYPAFDPDVVAPVLVRELDRAIETGWLVWRDKRYAVTEVRPALIPSVFTQDSRLQMTGFATDIHTCHANCPCHSGGAVRGD